MPRRLSILAAILCLTSADTLAGQAQQPAKMTRQQFQQLEWILGVWRGSGGAYPAFYEEYRVVNDSTIGMRGFTDSTFSVVADSSAIEWRGGFVQSRSGQTTYIVMAFTPTSVTFVRQGPTRGSHTFAQTSPDSWTATLNPSDPRRQPTIYFMRRIRR